MEKSEKKLQNSFSLKKIRYSISKVGHKEYMSVVVNMKFMLH